MITLITILLINLESSLAQRIDEVASIKADTSQESKAPILIIQPKYMRSEVVMMIPKARNTVYSAGYLSKLGLTNFKAEEFRMKYRGGWKEFKKKALKQSAILLKSIQPEYIKNTQGDIEYNFHLQSIILYWPVQFIPVSLGRFLKHPSGLIYG